MYIVRKKYIVKAVGFLIALLFVIAGIFFQNSKTVSAKERDINNKTISILTNVCASVENLNQSFEKGISLNSFDSENKEIYAECKSIRNTLFLCDYTMENTILWFTELTEYAKTDMSDSTKNQEFYNKLQNTKTLFINICSNYRKEESLIQIEEFFLKEKDENYYKAVLNELENQYSLLENQIVADRKDVTEFAKKLLNFPLTPNTFKGNYNAPKSVTYSISNSYANIFPSGKILGRMASEDTSSPRENFGESLQEAVNGYISQYASYIPSCTEVFSFENDTLIYYIFCPEINSENNIIINYNEPVKLAISTNDYSLKAFDATSYLKKHGKTSTPYQALNPPQTIPASLNGQTVLSQKTVLIGEDLFYEFKFTTDNGQTFYCITDTNNKQETVYTEKEYLRRTGLI